MMMLTFLKNNLLPVFLLFILFSPGVNGMAASCGESYIIDGTLNFVADYSFVGEICEIYVEAICIANNDPQGLQIDIVSQNLASSESLKMSERYMKTYYSTDFSTEIIDFDNPTNIEINKINLGNSVDLEISNTRGIVITHNKGTLMTGGGFELNISPLDLVLNETTFQLREKVANPSSLRYWSCGVNLELNECATIGCDATASFTRIPQRIFSCEEKFTCPNDECGCSKVKEEDVNTRQGRVIGGQDAISGEFPWLVVLDVTKLDETNETCGGTLITPNVVLTSAHCMILTSIEQRIGKHIPHPDYSYPNLENDFAGVIFDEPIIDSDTIGFICLPFTENSSPNIYRKGRIIDDGIFEATIIGFGQTDESDPIKSSTLQKAIVPILSDEECVQNYQTINKFIDVTKFFCASAPDINACKGDCGGPVAILRTSDGAYELAGCVSFDINCKAGVHSRIGPIEAFIVDVIRESFIIKKR